jgi:predicted nucleic acid-binding protein
MVCLDTDLMVDYISQRPRAVAFVEAAVSGGVRLATTVINVCELYRGSDQSTQPGRQKVARLLDFLDVLELDMRAAVIYREHYLSLASSGEPIGDFDLLIACIAMAHGESLASGNYKHFSKVAGLRLEKI